MSCDAMRTFAVSPIGIDMKGWDMSRLLDIAMGCRPWMTRLLGDMATAQVSSMPVLETLLNTPSVMKAMLYKSGRLGVTNDETVCKTATFSEKKRFRRQAHARP